MDYHEYTGYVTSKSSKRLKEAPVDGEIHSVFGKTLNIVLNDQFPHLVTLGDEVVKGGPNSIYFPEFREWQTTFKLGQGCELTKNALVFNTGVQLSLKELPEQEELTSFRAVSHLITKKRYLAAVLEKQRPYRDTDPANYFYQQIFIELKKLNQLIIAEKWQEVTLQGKRLLGLGVGLTPSGDDVLTSLLLVLQTQPLIWQELSPYLVDPQLLLGTNIISGHQLYFARQGEAKPVLIKVINGLLNDQKLNSTFQGQVAAVLQIGSTSGYDLLLGVLNGIELLNRMGVNAYEELSC